MLPMLSNKLRAQREARGCSQYEMATLLGVEKTTIWRWENGRERPAGADVIAKIKDVLGISQQELDSLFLEWIEYDEINSRPFEVKGIDYLIKREARRNGIPSAYVDMKSMYESLLEELIDIDYSVIPNADPALEGTPEQWAPIFESTPYSWRVLVRDDEIFGYWHFCFLREAIFRKAMSGTLLDTEITEKTIEVPTIRSEKNFFGYITMVAVKPCARHPQNFNLLYDSFVQEVLRLANEGVFFREIGATAWTLEGINLCIYSGMERIARQSDHTVRESQLADVFHLSFEKKPPSNLVFRNEKLGELYKERFAMS